MDEKLLNMGITDGGQLPVVEPYELGQELQVEALIYGTVLEASYLTMGIYLKKAVDVSFRMVAVRSGDVIWEDRRSSVDQRIEFRNIGRRLLGQIVEKAVRSLASHPLRPQAERVVHQVASTLPRGW